MKELRHTSAYGLCIACQCIQIFLRAKHHTQDEANETPQSAVLQPLN